MRVENLAECRESSQIPVACDFDGGNEIRGILRSRYRTVGHSLVDVIEPTTIRSNPIGGFSVHDPPRQRGVQTDDCGENPSVFEDCGYPKYIGCTCGSAHCLRCWPVAVKDKTSRANGKLEIFRWVACVPYQTHREIESFGGEN